MSRFYRYLVIGHQLVIIDHQLVTIDNVCVLVHVKPVTWILQITAPKVRKWVYDPDHPVARGYI